MQRKFVREHPESEHQSHFHNAFKEWLTETFNGGIPTDEQFKNMREEDKGIDYSQKSFVENDEIEEEIEVEEVQHINTLNQTDLEGDLNDLIYQPI